MIALISKELYQYILGDIHNLKFKGTILIPIIQKKILIITQSNLEEIGFSVILNKYKLWKLILINF